jgi:UDP-GlcNAc:undecaprenyl-phosphate GlcNAc-1-phosphate transferase
MAWFAVVLSAVALGWAGTRLVRAIAPRVGLLDAPDGGRKLQAHPVPLGGGLAVFAATAAAVGVAALLIPDVRGAIAAEFERAAALLAAAVVIVVVGLLDDLIDLRARYKLFGQLAAVTLLVGPGGMVVRVLSVLGWEFELPPAAAYAVTYLWFLAAVNALNLLDGMDGLLGTLGVIAGGAVAAMAGVNGYPLAGAVALALAGALAGFLRYNLPPASIYLGDCGSMLVGLVIAAVSIEASVKSRAVAVIAPAALLVLPFLDTSAAIVRRQLSGRGWAVPDRDHLHHVLVRGGRTVRRALALVAVLGAVAAVGAVVGSSYKSDLVSLITAGGVVLALVAGGLFGSHELRLIRDRAGLVLAAARRRSAPVRPVQRIPVARPDESPVPNHVDPAEAAAAE